MVKLLLENGAHVDLQDSGGWSALMHASWKGRCEVVRQLLINGAQVDLQDGAQVDLQDGAQWSAFQWGGALRSGPTAS